MKSGCTEYKTKIEGSRPNIYNQQKERQLSELIACRRSFFKFLVLSSLLRVAPSELLLDPHFDPLPPRPFLEGVSSIVWTEAVSSLEVGGMEASSTPEV